MKHKSKYALRLARRKAFGKIRVTLPVDSLGQITLNPKQFVIRAGKLVTRTIERLARADEVRRFS